MKTNENGRIFMKTDENIGKCKNTSENGRRRMKNGQKQKKTQ